MVPFNGVMVPVMLRELTPVQIKSCGDFSLIETFQDKVNSKSKKLKMADIIEYSEMQNKITRLALVKPTYDEVISIYDGDAVVKNAKEIIIELEKEAFKLVGGVKKDKLVEEIKNMRIWIDLLLPNDFTAWITAYVFGVDKSDIKSVTEKMLYEAAMMAKLGGDNPADHLQGNFTAFMREDINRRAWSIYAEKNKQKKRRK
jgi:hypothetical protein